MLGYVSAWISIISGIITIYQFLKNYKKEKSNKKTNKRKKKKK